MVAQRAAHQFDERMAREIKLLLEFFAPGRPICGAVIATSMLRHLGWEVDLRIDLKIGSASPRRTPIQ